MLNARRLFIGDFRCAVVQIWLLFSNGAKQLILIDKETLARNLFPSLAGVLDFIWGYMTWAMKLPMVSAA